MSRFKIPNPKVVVLCILAATTFWFLNAMSKSYTTTISVPLKFNYDSKKFIKVSESASSFEVKVNGLGWDILLAYVGYNLEPCIYQVDQLKSDGTIQAATLYQEVSQTLHDLKVNYVLKKSLNTGLELKSSKSFDLTVDPKLIPIDALTELNGDIELNPSKINVEGPESDLEIDSIMLNSFYDITTSDSFFTAKVNIGKKFSRFCKISDSIIQIKAPVLKYYGREKSVKIDVLGARSKSAKINVPNVIVKFVELNSTEPYTFKKKDFYVNLSEWNPKDSTIAIKMNNLNLKGLDFEPKSVKFLGYE